MLAVVLGLITATVPSSRPVLLPVCIVFPVVLLGLQWLAPAHCASRGYVVVVLWLVLVVGGITGETMQMHDARRLWTLGGFWWAAALTSVVWTALAAPGMKPGAPGELSPGSAVVLVFGGHTVIVYCLLLQWNAWLPQAPTSEFTRVVMAKQVIGTRMARHVLTLQPLEAPSGLYTIDVPRGLYGSVHPGERLLARVYPGRLGEPWVAYTPQP